MKLILIILFLSFTCLNAKDYNIYSTEVIKELKVGDETGSYSVNFLLPSEPNGPSATAFDKDGCFYILNHLDKKVVKYDKNFDFIAEFHNQNTMFGGVLTFDKSGKYILYSSPNIFSIYSENFDELIVKVWLIDTPYFNKILPNSFVLIDEKVFFRNITNDEIYYIDKPVADYLINNLNIKKANNLIEKVDKNKLKRHIKDFINSEDVDIEKKFKTRIDKVLKKSNRVTYINTDDDFNTYWKLSSLIIVINSKGDFVDIFIPENKKLRQYPSIHPSGDLYYLSYNEEQIQIHLLRRKW